MRVFFGVLVVGGLVVLGGAFAGAEDGAALYAKNCVSCHGADGKAQTPAGKAMKALPIAGMSAKPDEVVAKVKASDKHKALAAKLSDADLMAIAKALPPAN